MRRLRVVLSYIVAVLMIVVAVAALAGSNFLAAKLVAVTGIRVSPWYTGGEVANIIEHGSYQTLIHRPVFDALIDQATEGFVQLDWQPLAALPEYIDEDIDCFGNGNIDGHIKLDTRNNIAQFTSYSSQAVSLAGSYKLKDRVTIRVVLLRD
ncbi:MAG: hypothetical protein H6Q74_89 [Firmicutes bacterium]|nr:hypothetical protein [Bacillota bacterium]